MVTIIAMFASLIIAFGLMGMWEWVWLSIALFVGLGIAEYIAIKSRGDTITGLFKQVARTEPRKAIIATALLAGAMATVLLHLWGILP